MTPSRAPGPQRGDTGELPIAEDLGTHAQPLLEDAFAAPAEAGGPEAELGGRVGRGAAWSALNSMVLRLAQFLVGVAVARLVAPQELGVFVVALTVFSIVVNVSEIGVSAALVREVDNADRIAPTVATISLVTGAAWTVLMFLTADLLASALGAAQAGDSIRMLSLLVIIAGAGAVPSALLQRDFMQRRKFVLDLVNFVSANGLLLILLAGGGGAMSLAVSRVVGQSLSTVLLIVWAQTRYRPGFDRAEAGRLLRFGLPLAGANFLGFLIGNLDFMVVGRLRGSLRLGYYNLAYNVSGWPLTVFSAVLASVALPTFTRVRHDAAQLREHVGATLAATTATAFPVCALLYALSAPLVDAVYGHKWAPAAPALAVLAVFGAARVLIAALTDLVIAIGDSRGLLLMQVIWACVLVPALIGGVHLWGIVGAGVAHLVVALLVVLPSYLVLVSRRIPELAPLALMGRVLAPLAASTLAGIAAHLVSREIGNAWLALVAGGLAGLAVYGVVLSRWLLGTVRTLRRMYGKGSPPPQAA